MADDAELIRTWLNDVMRRTGLKPTPLAKQAGLAPSTLLRALDETQPTALERRSIRKIVDKFGVAEPYLRDAAVQHGPGFAENDIEPLEEQPPAFAGLPLTPNQYVAVALNRKLDLAGILPGDELLLDMSATPQPDDIVAAQVYSRQGNGAETLLRIYDPPYLLTLCSAVADRGKPLLVDGERVRIAAVMLKDLRHRRAA